MFLGSYRFEGEADVLLPAYERLMSSYPPDALDLHLCVVDDGGITVFDACPSRDVFTAFSTSPTFRGAVEAAGLPEPTIRQLGDVHRARLRTEIAP